MKATAGHMHGARPQITVAVLPPRAPEPAVASLNPLRVGGSKIRHPARSGVIARAAEPKEPDVRKSAEEVAIEQMGLFSLFELERPDSRARVRPTDGAATEATRRLKRRRKRLLTELETVDDLIEELAVPSMAFQSFESFDEASKSGQWDVAVGLDYSYLAKSAGRYTDELATGPPVSALRLGISNFRREFKELAASIFGRRKERLVADLEAEIPDDASQEEAARLKLNLELAQECRELINNFTLSNAAVWEREEAREQIDSPFILKGPYLFLCVMIDVLFDNRPVDRFWFLESVARMPYLSYVSMLHLYESLGWWRRGAKVKSIHFAEEWNEFHHLLIMESLGGDQAWSTRFFAQHASIAYYFALCFLWLISPTLAYNFSELIEAHAVDSYEQFMEENEAEMKRVPPPPIALSYYMGEDLYKYDEFQTERAPGTRRVVVRNLYDVFEAIAGDEAEHVKTMAACQQIDTIENAARTEAFLVKTALVLYLADLGLNKFAEYAAATDELPEFLETLSNFAQMYTESGTVDAIIDVLSRILPFLSG